MKDKFGDLFTTNAKIIGHGVNCDGVMGAGIAKAFREQFPENYRWYRSNCLQSSLHAGDAFVWRENDKMIMNFASQDRPGHHAKYPWLFSALYNGASVLSRDGDLKGEYGTTIAIPEIGCGIGGLEWKKAAQVIQTVEAVLDNEIQFEVWHYDSTN